MKEGSALSFARAGGAVYHYAIYLGRLYDHGKPIIGHYYKEGNEDTKIRVDYLEDVVKDSTLRVYECKCNTMKRSNVILKLYLRELRYINGYLGVESHKQTNRL